MRKAFTTFAIVVFALMFVVVATLPRISALKMENVVEDIYDQATEGKPILSEQVQEIDKLYERNVTALYKAEREKIDKKIEFIAQKYKEQAKTTPNN